MSAECYLTQTLGQPRLVEEYSQALLALPEFFYMLLEMPQKCKALHAPWWIPLPPYCPVAIVVHMVQGGIVGNPLDLSFFLSEWTQCFDGKKKEKCSCGDLDCVNSWRKEEDTTGDE